MLHSLYGAMIADPATAQQLLAANAAAAAASEPAIGQKDTTFTKIFVGGLPYHTSDKTLREYFEQFGEIDEAVVITDRQTNKSRGYGFVTMRDRVGADRACKDPNPIIDGRKANVNLAYLGAKPRGNLQLAGLSALPLQTTTATIPTLLQGRLGLQQFYYPSSLLASPTAGLVSMSPLSPTAGLDYSAYAAAAQQYNAAAAAAAYEPYAALGNYGNLSLVPATAYAQAAAAYQAQNASNDAAGRL